MFFDKLFKKLKNNDIKAVSVGEPKTEMLEPLPLYEFVTPVDCFYIYYNRYGKITPNIGDVLVVKFEPSEISNTTDAVVYADNIKYGYLQHNIAKWKRILYGKNDFNVVVDSLDMNNEKPQLFVKIKLPYQIKDIHLPLKITLVGVTFENRQEFIRQSHKGDLLIIRHEPSDDYPTTIKVYNKKLNKCIGVLPNETAVKYLKHYKQNCTFDGVITSIYGGYNNFGVDIVMLNKITEV